MTILKPGKLKKHLFVCPECGCEFVAKQTEFEVNKNSFFKKCDHVRNIDLYEETVYVLYKHCPCCDKQVIDENTAISYKTDLQRIAEQFIDNYKKENDNDQ